MNAPILPEVLSGDQWGMAYVDARPAIGAFRSGPNSTTAPVISVFWYAPETAIHLIKIIEKFEARTESTDEFHAVLHRYGTGEDVKTSKSLARYIVPTNGAMKFDAFRADFENEAGGNISVWANISRSIRRDRGRLDENIGISVEPRLYSRTENFILDAIKGSWEFDPRLAPEKLKEAMSSL